MDTSKDSLIFRDQRHTTPTYRRLLRKTVPTLEKSLQVAREAELGRESTETLMAISAEQIHKEAGVGQIKQ